MVIERTYVTWAKYHHRVRDARCHSGRYYENGFITRMYAQFPIKITRSCNGKAFPTSMMVPAWSRRWHSCSFSRRQGIQTLRLGIASTLTRSQL